MKLREGGGNSAHARNFARVSRIGLGVERAQEIGHQAVRFSWCVVSRRAAMLRDGVQRVALPRR